jgi:two-component system cell cycle response regulator
VSADVCGAGTFPSVEEAVTFAAVAASLKLGDRERIAVTGFDGYIQKPTDPVTFVGKVERLRPKRLARHAMREPQ